MTYTVEQLRELASCYEGCSGTIGDLRESMLALADALEENARLKAEKPAPQWLTDNLLQRAERAEAELAKLRQHAEAMAERLDAWARIDECKCSEVDAYRRDFPKEEK